MFTISVFHCTLMFINPARLFHDFQNVEWLVQRRMIGNYEVKCILTTLNDLHCVESFVLTWIICTCNVECVLTVERFALLLNDLDGSMKLLENIPRKTASEFSLPCKSQQWILPHKKTPQVEIPTVIIALQQMK